MLETLLATFPWLETEYYDTALWVWLALPVGFLATWTLSRIVTGFLFSALSNTKASNLKPVDILCHMSGPISLLLAAMMLNALNSLLPVNANAQPAVQAFDTFIYALAVAWTLFIITNEAYSAVVEKLQRNHQETALGIMPLMRKMTKAAIVALTILFLLQNWGFDVAAIIAALGIGGVAIALASQKSVENLFGGVMIALDQPIRVGEFGRFGDFIGTVEDIGLRSTRIRTLDRTIKSIPNSEFSSMQIETFATRDKILFLHTLGLRYETTSDQIRYIISEIKKMLTAHPKVLDDPARPRFVSYGDYSLNIEIFAYIETMDWNEFLEIQEDILLHLKDIVEEAGSDFAFPSQTIYFERGEGMDSDKQDDINKKVSSARDKGVLQWPDLSDDERKRVANTLSFPPKGSAIAS